MGKLVETSPPRRCYPSGMTGHNHGGLSMSGERFEWMDERQAAEILGVAFWTMRNWRQQEKGPPYLKIGGKVRYRAADLEAFLRKRLHDPEGCLGHLAVPTEGAAAL